MRVTIAAAGLALLLAGCAALSGPTISAAPVSIGKDLVGEACTSALTRSDDAAGIAQRAYVVHCGTWEEPSARIFRIAGGSTPLPDLAAGGAWRDYLGQRMICAGTAETTILGGDKALLLQCKLKNGGWPYLALAATVAGSTYLADGIPATLPAIETSIAQAAGRAAAEADTGSTMSAARAVLEAQLQGRVFGAGDLATYAKLFQVGQYDDAVRDFAGAEDSFRDALAVHQRLLGPNNPASADAMMNLALEISNQRRYIEADALLQQAGRLLGAGGDENLAARLVSYRAINAANQGKRDEALGFARQATQRRKEIHARYAQNQTALAFSPQAGLQTVRSQAGVLDGAIADAAQIDVVQSLYIEAGIETRRGNLAAAKALADDGVSRLRATRVKPEWWVPQYGELEAEIAERSGDLAAAESWLRDAAQQWPTFFSKSRPQGIVQFALGGVLHKQGRDREALDAFRSGSQIIDAAGGGLTFAQVRPYLETATSVIRADPTQAARLGADMFAAAQLARNNMTARSIAQAAARLATSDGTVGELIRAKQETDRERSRLQNDYVFQSTQGPESQDKERLTQLQARIVALETQGSAINAQVQAASPGYNQLVQAGAGADEILQALRPGEAMLVIVVGDPQSYGFLLRDGKVDPYQIAAGTEEIGRRVQAVRQGVTVQPNGTLLPFDVKAAYDLYALLFGPVASGLAGIDRLVVAPTGVLLGIPFSILVSADPGTSRDYGKAAWLIRRFAVSTVPSARAFLDLRRNTQASAAPQPFIGFGDFRPSPGLEPAALGLPESCRDDATKLRSLEALPATAAELNAVARTLGAPASDLRLKDRFTTNAVETAALDRFKVVYFATHALLPTDLDCLSQAMLVTSFDGSVTVPAVTSTASAATGSTASAATGSTASAATGMRGLIVGGVGLTAQAAAAARERAGLLSAARVMELKLNADIVVLSACNTAGPGNVNGGESLSGLARSFFYAGSRSMLVTQWSVDDEATSALMVATFQRLSGNLTAGATALRAAQLGFLDGAGRGMPAAWSNPFYWGAFVFVGDGGSAPAIKS